MTEGQPPQPAQPAQPTPPPQPAQPVKRATAGFAISLVGGIIDAVIAIIILVAASYWETLAPQMPGYGPNFDFGASFLALWGGIGLVLAIIVIVGAVLIYMPGKETIGGILVIVFSIISLFFTAGGLIIGLILGIIGGALGIAKK